MPLVNLPVEMQVNGGQWRSHQDGFGMRTLCICQQCREEISIPWHPLSTTSPATLANQIRALLICSCSPRNPNAPR